MEENETKARFFKHRRNMLLLSGIFVFLTLSGGSLDSINILGTKLTFQNPEAPLNIIVICMIYMLIKYIQFLSEMGGTGIKRSVKSIVELNLRSFLKSRDDNRLGKDSGIPQHNYDIISYINYFTYTVKLNLDEEIVRKVTSGPNKNLIPLERTVGFNDLWTVYLKAYLGVVCKTVWFAEYILPIALAICGFVLYFFPDIVPQFFLSTP
ncbi:MAG: hypothetical protein JAZ17_07775 [Candidatus Thiodiazotropha endolucinida]|nr:hypothetical protein [Candidatus Thiodiazotropha endolucinida]